MKRPRPLPILPFADGGGVRIEVQPLDDTHGSLSMAPHGHGFFEMIYVERGSGVHRVGGARVRVSPGDLFVVAPGEAHDAREMRDVRGRLVLFTADALRPGRTEADAFVALPGELLLLAFLRTSAGGEHVPSHLRVPPRGRARFVALLVDLENELRARKLGWEEASRARLTLLLVEAARLAAPALASITPSHRPLVGDVFRFIEARYTRPITLVDVARAVGRSSAYLTDVVRRETGRTVGAWVIERRMAEARRRLVETDDSVAVVAEALGYDDESYFARRFRKAHGASPASWRSSRR